jgi:nitrogen fixation NifU-like protein
LHTPEFLEHFRNPRNVGDLPAPAISVEAANPVCGDTLRLSVLWDQNGRVAAAAFRSRGCPAAIAAGSALTEWLRGRSRHDLATLEPGEIDRSLGGLPAASAHAAVLCCDAVRLLLRAR